MAPEDYFFNGGISSAATVLAATDHPVGLGIVSCVARHPAVLAMECSVLSRMHPGRLTPGSGWVCRAGSDRWALPGRRSRRSRVRHRSARLLAGEAVTRTGRSFLFDRVKLTHPETSDAAIYIGVIGPEMLRLAGRIADGTIMSVFASHEYLRWMREQVAGRADPRRDDPPADLFALTRSTTADREVAASVRRWRSTCRWSRNKLIDVYGIRRTWRT